MPSIEGSTCTVLYEVEHALNIRQSIWLVDKRALGLRGCEYC